MSRDGRGASGRGASSANDGSSTRRGFLGALGAAAAAGLAGCSASDAAPQANGAGTSPDGGTTTSPNGGAGATPAGADGEGASVFTQVYRQTIGSVVQIMVPNGGLGSGFVYDANHVVTNYHVVTTHERVQVQFARGESVTGRVVGTDQYTDLAVVRVENKPDYATPLSLVNEEPAIGTRVAAIGSPYGLDGSLTHGIVSGVNRLVPSPNASFSIPNAIQTDAPVNPGNSGGPLMNLDGEVLGVINSGGGNDIAFAISAPMTQKVVSALIKDGVYRHPFLGVSLVDVTEAVARANNLDRARGLLVRDVVSGSPAEGVLQPSTRTTRVSGFQVPVGGDVIVSVNGHQISSRQELLSYLELNTTPGETVKLGIIRNGKRRTVTVTVGARREFQQ